MKHSHLRKAALLMLGTLLLTSCAAKSANRSAVYDTEMTQAVGSEPQSPSRDGSENGNGFLSYGSSSDLYDTVEAENEPIVDLPQNEAQAEHKIVYSSWFEINTKEYDTSVADLNALCKRYGAYFESAQSYGDKTYSNRYSSYTVRIPKDQYFDFIESTGTLGTIIGSGENNRDVTEQYFDTEARLESATVREERLLAILEKSDTLDDVLLLERELADVRYEIESYTGELKKLDSLVSYSTATVTLTEVKTDILPDSDKQSFGTRLSLSLSRGWESFRAGLSDLAVDFMYEVPVLLCVWLPILIVLVVLIVVIRKKRKKRRSARLSAQNGGTASTAAEKTDTTQA